MVFRGHFSLLYRFLSSLSVKEAESTEILSLIENTVR